MKPGEISGPIRIAGKRRSGHADREAGAIARGTEAELGRGEGQLLLAKAAGTGRALRSEPARAAGKRRQDQDQQEGDGPSGRGTKASRFAAGNGTGSPPAPFCKRFFNPGTPLRGACSHRTQDACSPNALPGYCCTRALFLRAEASATSVRRRIEFVDWLAAAKQTLWQVLPFGPVGSAIRRIPARRRLPAIRC